MLVDGAADGRAVGRGAAVAVVILNAAFALSYFTAARRCTVPEISEK